MKYYSKLDLLLWPFVFVWACICVGSLLAAYFVLWVAEKIKLALLRLVTA